MNVRSHEIYYYDTERAFETERVAGCFLKLLLEEMKRQRKTKVLFLCIGTDRSTGDSLGPLIGYKLTERGITNARILGTLEKPVHAMNLDQYLCGSKDHFADYVIVAVDASVGNTEHIGYVTLGRGALKPGLGVSKEIEAVGDLFITGIVGSSKCGDPLMLQSVRLSVVMRLADCIVKSVLLSMNIIGKRVENFFAGPPMV